ncbi:MAG: hypothetical protein C0622_07580 [Desulfuromonas sp.]|nr:MAG: hypothetical protein C0622_07580 [Desulfuromonas sp.]
MEQFKHTTIYVLLLATLLLVAVDCQAALYQSRRGGGHVDVAFQYLLSDFSGPVSTQWARVVCEPTHQETYTLNQSGNEVRIYNHQGMEIYAFGADGGIVSALDVATDSDGTIYLLARDFSHYGVQVHDYSGQLKGEIVIQDPSPLLAEFRPDRLEIGAGNLYLLDSGRCKLAVIDTRGRLLRAFDLTAQIAPEREREGEKTAIYDISGFSVAGDGNIYLTVPTLFSAYRLNSEGRLEAFGTSGSGPGKFGVVSGITADAAGHIYVADRLRSVVLIFDRDFKFLGEFGYRGGRPEDMLVPDDLAYDPQQQHLFVSQAANKGVGVYKITIP